MTYRYIYNGERVLEELNDSGGVLARYTTENDSYYGTLLHLQRYTGESRFPIYDEIGSARGLIDAGGTVTDSYDMDTFGKPIQTTGSTPNPYRYGAAWGYITDPNGFLQLGARYYWPEVGRFVSQDPEKDGHNWFSYVGANPLVSADPDGWFCWHAFGGCIGTTCHGDPSCPPKKGKGGKGSGKGADNGKGGDGSGAGDGSTSLGQGQQSGGQMAICPARPDANKPNCNNRVPNAEDCKSCLDFPGEPSIAYNHCADCCMRGVKVGTMTPGRGGSYNQCQSSCSDWMDLHQPTP